MAGLLFLNNFIKIRSCFENNIQEMKQTIIINQRIIIILTVVLFPCILRAKEHRLWYKQPAQNWNEALPIGNGRLGAMVFGGTSEERIQLNEETVWTRGPRYEDKKDAYKSIPEIQKLIFDGNYVEAEKRCKETLLTQKKGHSSTYQTLGDLFIQFENIGAIDNYNRELDLNSALITTDFETNGTKHTRRIFSSAVDQAIIFQAESNKKGSISCTVVLSRPGEGETISADSGILIMRQHVNNKSGVRYETQLKVISHGGKLVARDGKIIVSNADKLELRLVAATDYKGGNPSSLCNDYLKLSNGKSFTKLLKRHIKDYQSFYNRVEISLPTTAQSELPTNERIAAQKEGKADSSLAALYFQFGRYLLISSSRPGCLPANLQGIWAGELNPAWFSDYHLNINAQMNYWPAEVTNLTELHVPFLKYIGRLRERGRKTAREVYGVNGFVAHHRSDVWHFTAPYGAPRYGMWPMGAAWASTHFWEHFQFGGDKTFLADFGYPVMREAAQFLSEIMVIHPETGKWIIGPSISPENTYLTPDSKRGSVVMGAAMDIQIIYHLFNSVIEASKLLGIDKEFREILREQLENLTEVKIGKDGRILEWSDEDLKEAEPGHRHMSHLYGLYPSNEYNWNNKPEYMQAACKVITDRLKYGGGHTGWSRAWMINFYVRLLDKENAWDNLEALWAKSTHPNLFDDHPPFQIDGNFGATAAIAEMLLQSHAGEINLLPCLPKAINTGRVKGLVARGGYVIDLEWKDGQLTEATIMSRSDSSFKLRYGNTVRTIKLGKGKRLVLDKNLQEL